MSQIKVEFEYRAGVTQNIFRNVRLMGSWSPDGRHSDIWRTVVMKPFLDESGCIAFRAEVLLAEDQVGQVFTWGVLVDVQGRPNIWGVMTEFGPLDAAALHRCFTLAPEGSVERYWVTHCRRLGANKYFTSTDKEPGIQFALWAPNARKVETVIGEADGGGYIWANGRGVQASFAMTRDDEGIWKTDPGEPELARYSQWLQKPYMFRVTREDGSVAYRTDLFSRHQIGSGGQDPEIDEWSGQSADLLGTRSCSMVVDPDMLTHKKGASNSKEAQWLSEREFWANEFNPLRPLPSRMEDLVIYELHIGGLGAGSDGPGTLQDAMEMLDYLVDLGINAIELMPMSEFDGEAGWGYGTSHFFAIKYDSGGWEQFKHFVRACHRHGIAVIMDVVYNHYTPDSERAEWMYDTTRDDHNIYYFYQGCQEDYPEDMPEGGYCDNMSTGYLPNMAEEMVRKMLISSAVTMALEFHVDGFRMDLTQALHSFNVLHYDGSPVAPANEAGIRFMREWVRTLRLFKPFVFLIAEDHSGWAAMTTSQSIGGIGFSATWWADWYHQLIGDSDGDESKAHLLKNAGLGFDDPLAMELFGQVFTGSPHRVVYHESHDEAGNSANSARNMQVAVNGMLFDNTRHWAEARCRVVAGLTLLSAGTPMFFMGEEVGASEPYRYNDFLEHREDFQEMSRGIGSRMFRYYQDLIRLRLWSSAFRSPSLEILYTHDIDRVLAFRRWWSEEEYVVFASLNNQAFDQGYTVEHESLKGKTWVEVLNSDADIYGGNEVYNPEGVDSLGGKFKLFLPACGLAVFAKMG